MKLSQFSTDECASVICEIVPYMDNILKDEALREEISTGVKLPEGTTQAGVFAAGLDKLTAIVPIVLKHHKSDVFGILAAVNGVEPEDIGKQNIIKTGLQIREMCKDKELISFFKSWTQPGETES